MSTRRVVRFVIAGLFTAALASTLSPVAAQVGDTPAVKPAQVMTAEVTATLPVKGLTKENEEQVLTAVEALTVDAWFCPHCDARKAEGGICEACDVELRTEKLRVVQKVAAKIEKGFFSKKHFLTVTVAPGEQVRLSQLEKALNAETVFVQRNKLELTGKPVLVFRGATMKGDAMELQTAFREAELFEDVAVRFDETTMETHISVRPGEEPPTFAEVAAIGEEAEQRMQLSEVIWSAASSPVTG